MWNFEGVGILLEIPVIMKKTILCTALAMMFGLMGFSQGTGEVYGKVLDESGRPLDQVSVTCQIGDGLVGAFTDSTGHFRLKPLPNGQQNIQFKLAGYHQVEMNGVVIKSDQITYLENVVMKDTMNTLAGIEIIYYKIPLIDKDGGNVTAIAGKELNQMSSSNGGDIKKMVASLSSDIKTDASGEELYFRGSRAGSVIYFIDGVKVRENVPNIPSSGISMMQVYTGGLPAKYGDTTGGVIVIETKSYLEDYNDKMRRQGLNP